MSVGLVFSLVLLWLALRGTDFSQIGSALAMTEPEYLPLLLAAIAAFFWYKTVRWRVLLTPVAMLDTRALFPVVVVGYASNILLPAQLGELARTYLAARKFRISAAPVLITIILERIFDFLTILIFVSAVLILEKNTPEELHTAAYVCGGIGIGALTVAIFHATKPKFLSRLFYRFTGLLPARLGKQLNTHFDLATGGLESLTDADRVFRICATSVIQWLIMAACIWLSIAALNLDVPASASFVVLAVVVVGMTIPSSPGFFGTIQFCFVLGLAPYGIDSGGAIAASVIFHGFMFATVALGGLVFLNKLGYTATELIRETEAGSAKRPPESGTRENLHCD